MGGLCIYEYIAHACVPGDVTPADVANLETMEVIEKIQAGINNDDLQRALSDKSVSDAVLSCGISKFIGNMTTNDKDEIVKLLCLRELLIEPKSAIDQFVEGLNELRVGEMVKRYPNQCETLFVTKELKKLKAEQLYDIFKPLYSVDGSNAKEKELEVMTYWMSFLEEC